MTSTIQSAAPVQLVRIVAAADQPNPLRGSPGLVGIPTVIAGAVGLALVRLNAAASIYAIGFVALAGYLHADAMSTETGGKLLPTGRPILSG